MTSQSISCHYRHVQHFPFPEAYQASSLYYVKSREQDKLRFIVFAHAFNVGFDRLDDKFTILQMNLVVRRYSVARVGRAYFCATLDNEFSDGATSILSVHHFRDYILTSNKIESLTCLFVPNRGTRLTSRISPGVAFRVQFRPLGH